MGKRKTVKKILKWLLAILLLLLLLLVGFYFALKSPKFQTFVAQKVTQSLSKSLGTEIDIEHVEIEFFNNLKLDKLLVLDQKEDTLLFFNKAEASINYFSMFGNTIDLDAITIDGLVLNIDRSRNDTLFNFSFLAQNKSKEKQETNEAVDWLIKMNQFTLNNSRVSFNDSLTGNCIQASLPSLQTELNDLDIKELKFSVEKLSLDQPNVLFTKLENYHKSDKPFDLNIPAQINLQNIIIIDGAFAFANTLDTNRYQNLAFNDLAFQKINLEVGDAFLFKDSIDLSIASLSSIEKSGFKLAALSSDFLMNSKKIQLDDFALKTNSSVVNTQAKLSYRSFEDFKDFANRVRFSAQLNNTIINPKDLEYFADIKKVGVQGVFKIDGKIKGRLNSIKAKDVVLQAGNQTSFVGDFSLNGLPKIKETFISLRVDELKTTYADLKYIHNKIPLPSNAKSLGNILFTGKFDGFYSDFVTYGEIRTDLGLAKTDINFKLAENGEPSYSGNLYGEDLNVGTWFGIEKLLGKITLNTSIKGKGVKLNTLDAVLKGSVDKISINNYEYSNIELDGSVKDKFFKGNAVIDDENIKMDFNGLVDATGKIPVYDFTAELDTLNLKALNISKREYSLSGRLKSKFTASSIDDVLGSLHVNDLKIYRKGKTYAIDKVSLLSTAKNNENQLKLNADYITMDVSGKYKISKLPQAFKQVFFAQENEFDSLSTENQHIRLDAEITDNTELIALFVPKLKIPEKLKVSANLDTKTESALASIQVPKLKYNNFKAEDFVSNIYVKNGHLDIINSLPVVYLKDSIFLKDVSLLANGSKDDLDFSINTAFKNEASALGVLGNLSYENNLFELSLDTSSTILINSTFWNIAEDNSILFNKDVFVAENFRLYSRKSEANIAVNNDNGTNNLALNLKNINVEDFADMLKDRGIDLKGKLNGEVKIDNFDKQPAINGDLSFLNIYVNDYNVGDFKVESRLDIPDQKVYLSGGLYSRENHIDINGSYSFSKKSTPKDFDINVFIKQFTVKSVEDFIPEYISNSSGTVHGNLKLVGNRKTPNLNGYVDVNDVTTTVSYTQVPYTIEKAHVVFKDNLIQLPSQVLVRDLEGNSAIGTGDVTHQNFKNWALNIDVETKKIKGLNTTLEDNPDFYGTAYINGGASFTGPTDDLLIYIHGESEGTSFIDVPLSEGVQNQKHSFYRFITKNEEQKEDPEEKENLIKVMGAKVKLDLDLDQDLELKIILDQDAGDILKVKGEGNVKIDVGKQGEFVNFYGTYNVLEGDYLFTLQNFVNKPFRIEPNSKIFFNGDIYKEATIDMAATYSRKVALEDFIAEYIPSGDEELKNLSKNRVPVTLYLNLSDKLSKPTINFDIGVDRVDPKLRNYVDSKLQALQLSDSELNNQIFGVLVLSRFLPSSAGLQNSIGTNLSDDVLNSVTELISSQLSRYLTDWASYVIKDLEFNVNFSSYDPELTLRKRRELQLALSKRFFNDRLSINVGGNFDFGESFNNGESSSTTFVGANVSFEYAITKNRRWRIKAFTISDYDNFSTDKNRNTRSGVGFSYRREFDDIYDLFNIKRKIKDADSKN